MEDGRNVEVSGQETSGASARGWVRTAVASSSSSSFVVSSARLGLKNLSNREVHHGSVARRGQRGARARRRRVRARFALVRSALGCSSSSSPKGVEEETTGARRRWAPSSSGTSGMSTSRDARARTFGVPGAVVSVRRGERDDAARGHRARRESARGRPDDATRAGASRDRGSLDDGTTARVRDARARARRRDDRGRARRREAVDGHVAHPRSGPRVVVEVSAGNAGDARRGVRANRRRRISYGGRAARLLARRIADWYRGGHFLSCT